MNRLKLSWKNGLKNPVEEYKHSFSRGYNISSKKDYNSIIKSLPKVPKDYEGFIPDEWFYGGVTIHRDDVETRDVVVRNFKEAVSAFKYIDIMQANIPMSVLRKIDFDVVRKYYLLCFLLEFLCRNRNVDLLMSNVMFDTMVEQLSNNDIIKSTKSSSAFNEIINVLNNCKTDMGDDFFHIVSSIKNKDGIYTVEFDTKQNIHQSVYYPIY